MNQQMEPYQETGGARVGKYDLLSANVTWPFANLTATTEEISLVLGFRKFRFRTFVIPREHFRTIGKKKGLFSTGVRIGHTVSAYPAFILFWTFRYSTLRENLERLGYDVSG